MQVVYSKEASNSHSYPNTLGYLNWYDQDLLVILFNLNAIDEI